VTPVTTVDSLWAAVSDSPDDDTLKLALADALLEADDADTASVIRWCVSNRRWPKKGFQRWSWTSGKTGPLPKKQTNVLPTPFYEQTKRMRWSRPYSVDAYDYSRSCRGQVELLAVAFRDLRDRGPQWLR
jgi:uncharacterized protein (TIGR02996 family)